MSLDDLREVIQHNRKLIQKYKRHKRVIEEQIASFSKLHAPSHLLLQISDIDEQIQDGESKLKKAKDNLIVPYELDLYWAEESLKILDSSAASVCLIPDILH